MAGRISQFGLEIARAGTPVARISQIALEVAYVVDEQRVSDSLNSWNDNAEISLVVSWVPVTQTVEDDLNNWNDSLETYQTVLYLISVEDDLDNWDDIQTQFGYLLADIADTLEFNDAQGYFVEYRPLLTDTLTFTDAKELLLAHFLTRRDALGSWRGENPAPGNPSRYTPLLRDGTPNWQIFGQVNIVVVDDSNRWADSWDEDTIVNLVGRGVEAADAFLFIDTVKVILNYLKETGSNFTFSDVASALYGYIIQVTDDSNNLNDGSTTFTGSVAVGPSVGDSLNYWLDAVSTFISDTFLSYIRRYLNDITYIPNDATTLLDLPIRNPQMIMYIRRYLNDVVPSIGISVNEQMSLGDSIS